MLKTRAKTTVNEHCLTDYCRVVETVYIEREATEPGSKLVPYLQVVRGLERNRSNTENVVPRRQRLRRPGGY